MAIFKLNGEQVTIFKAPKDCEHGKTQLGLHSMHERPAIYWRMIHQIKATEGMDEILTAIRDVRDMDAHRAAAQHATIPPIGLPPTIKGVEVNLVKSVTAHDPVERDPAPIHAEDLSVAVEQPKKKGRK